MPRPRGRGPARPRGRPANPKNKTVGEERRAVYFGYLRDEFNGKIRWWYSGNAGDQFDLLTKVEFEAKKQAAIELGFKVVDMEGREDLGW